MTKEKKLTITEKQLDEIWLGIHYTLDDVGVVNSQRYKSATDICDLVEDVILATLIGKTKK